MKTLIQNITNIYGKKGQEWLDNLPTIVEALSHYWKLVNIIPVDNMTYNYVVKAITHTNQHVVLKISCDKKSIIDEEQALHYFAGNGAIKLLDYNEQYYAMLLHQAVPGITLKSLYPTQVENVIEYYLSVVTKLHNNTFDGKHKFSHISEWLRSLDYCVSTQIPDRLLDKAINLKNALLASPGKQVLIHGDLHHDNILQDNHQWLAIDPKGIMGEAEFEIAAFDFIHSSEIENNQAVDQLFEKRIALITQQSTYNIQRIKDWVFIRLILAAAWCVEDKGDPSWDIKLAENIFPKYFA